MHAICAGSTCADSNCCDNAHSRHCGASNLYAAANGDTNPNAHGFAHPNAHSFSYAFANAFANSNRNVNANAFAHATCARVILPKPAAVFGNSYSGSYCNRSDYADGNPNADESSLIYPQHERLLFASQ